MVQRPVWLGEEAPVMGELHRGPVQESEGLREPGLSGPPRGHQEAGEVGCGHLLENLGDNGERGKGVRL